MKFKKFNDLMLGSQYDYVLWIPNDSLMLELVDLHSHKYDNYDVKSIRLHGRSIQIELVSKDVKAIADLELESELDFKQLCLEDCFDDIDQ